MNGHDKKRPTGSAPHVAQATEGHLHHYASAGIAEQEGHVPLWLWLVVASLLLWGIYYLFAYWNAPSAIS